MYPPGPSGLWHEACVVGPGPPSPLMLGEEVERLSLQRLPPEEVLGKETGSHH